MSSEEEESGILLAALPLSSFLRPTEKSVRLAALFNALLSPLDDIVTAHAKHRTIKVMHIVATGASLRLCRKAVNFETISSPILIKLQMTMVMTVINCFHYAC